MAIRIFGVGLLFVAALLVLFLYFRQDGEVTPKEHTLFFTIFVFMQFWNIFNAKAFLSGHSAFKGLFSKGGASGFLLTLAIIFIGQILIVTFGGEMSEVTPLSLGDWARIILGTSIILWVGEIGRIIKKAA